MNGNEIGYHLFCFQNPIITALDTMYSLQTW